MPDKSFIQNIGEQAASGVAGGLVGAGMGLLLEKHNDRRQIKQQQKLTDMQLNANKGMADYNRQMQLQMWRDTNYSAQMGELEKAGLNPGLIYGMSGGGATTTGSGGGSGVSGAIAPSGGGEAMGLMMQKMQIGLMEAQRQNIEAGTDKTKAETGILPLTGENIKASTASLTQGVQNAKAQENLTNIQSAIAELEKMKLDSSWIEQASVIHEELMALKYNNEITKDTLEEKKSLIRQELANAVITQSAIEKKIQLDTAQIVKIGNEIAQKWMELDIQTFNAQMNAAYPTIWEAGGNLLQQIFNEIDRQGGYDKNRRIPFKVSEQKNDD